MVLEAGIYELSVSINDSSGNENSIAYRLNVDKKLIEITADNLEKNYGELDPPLTYTIASGGLVFNDSIIGILERESGERVGDYNIGIGSLSIDKINNYDLTFIGGIFTISDHNAPFVELTQNETEIEWGIDSINITWLAEDETLYEVLFNLTSPEGMLIFESSNFGGEILFEPLNLTELGIYTVSLWANDSAGNENSTFLTFSPALIFNVV